MAAKKTTSGARVSTTLEEANELGFLGVEVDPTPDENYSVSGTLAGKPTPETDEKAAAKAEESK